MSADTQESWGDYKNYVEKLSIVENKAFPLAIGGAGIEDLIEPMVQEVIERAEREKPETQKDVHTMLASAIDTIYKVDLPWLAVKKQERTPEFLIAAKPLHEDYCIFRIKGRRIYRVGTKAIIGFGTPINYALLQRMYRENLPMQQAVMLAIYLVSLSKKMDEGVGGETSVAIVRDNGAWLDDSDYLEKSEAYIGRFLNLTDGLFLKSVDVSIAPTQFITEEMPQFLRDVSALRDEFANYSSLRSLMRTLHDPTFEGDPYAKIFGGATQTISQQTATHYVASPVREATREEKAERHRLTEDSEAAVNKQEAAVEFRKLLLNRQITYLGEETITIQGSGSS